mmetsp:Transcript_15820/g.42551  ORF Transcript_15820/g.42551 Transcript_15820/m.42551 type:complete len:353 (+) Transcript_15820:317-1375(+)
MRLVPAEQIPEVTVASPAVATAVLPRLHGSAPGVCHALPHGLHGRAGALEPVACKLAHVARSLSHAGEVDAAHGCSGRVHHLAPDLACGLHEGTPRLHGAASKGAEGLAHPLGRCEVNVNRHLRHRDVGEVHGIAHVPHARDHVLSELGLSVNESRGSHTRSGGADERGSDPRLGGLLLVRLGAARSPSRGSRHGLHSAGLGVHRGALVNVGAHLVSSSAGSKGAQGYPLPVAALVFLNASKDDSVALEVGELEATQLLIRVRIREAAERACNVSKGSALREHVHHEIDHVKGVVHLGQPEVDALQVLHLARRLLPRKHISRVHHGGLALGAGAETLEVDEVHLAPGLEADG